MAIIFVNMLYNKCTHKRLSFINFKGLNPKVITVIEEEAYFVGVGLSQEGDFFCGFSKSLRWFRVYFEALEESFA